MIFLTLSFYSVAEAHGLITLALRAKISVLLSRSPAGADRYMLFCGPMFVPAIVLSQPNFKPTS